MLVSSLRQRLTHVFNLLKLRYCGYVALRQRRIKVGSNQTMITEQLMNTSRPIAWHLWEHFGSDPTQLSVVHADYPLYRHACVHTAIEQHLHNDDRNATYSGVKKDTSRETSLEEMVNPRCCADFTQAPALYVNN